MHHNPLMMIFLSLSPNQLSSRPRGLIPSAPHRTRPADSPHPAPLIMDSFRASLQANRERCIEIATTSEIKNRYSLFAIKKSKKTGSLRLERTRTSGIIHYSRLSLVQKMLFPFSKQLILPPILPGGVFPFFLSGMITQPMKISNE